MRKVGIDHPPNLSTLESNQPSILIRSKISSKGCKRNSNSGLCEDSSNQRPKSIEPGPYGSKRVHIGRNIISNNQESTSSSNAKTFSDNALKTQNSFQKSTNKDHLSNYSKSFKFQSFVDNSIQSNDINSDTVIHKQRKINKFSQFIELSVAEELKREQELINKSNTSCLESAIQDEEKLTEIPKISTENEDQFENLGGYTNFLNFDF